MTLPLYGASGIEALFEPEMGFAGGRRVPKARPDAQKNFYSIRFLPMASSLDANKQAITFFISFRFVIGFIPAVKTNRFFD